MVEQCVVDVQDEQSFVLSGRVKFLDGVIANAFIDLSEVDLRGLTRIRPTII